MARESDGRAGGIVVEAEDEVGLNDVIDEFGARADFCGAVKELLGRLAITVLEIFWSEVCYRSVFLTHESDLGAEAF